MRIEEQAPIIGSAFVGGMSQSWLIKEKPEWSWLLSLGLIGGGIFLGTRRGWQEQVGVGLAASGASGLSIGLMGMALVPKVEGESAIGAGSEARARMLQAARTQRQALGMGMGAKNASGVGQRYPAQVKEDEFEGIRLR